MTGRSGKECSNRSSGGKPEDDGRNEEDQEAESDDGNEREDDALGVGVESTVGIEEFLILVPSGGGGG